MQCSKCGQEVPADAIYCPHCTGDRKTTDRDVIRGGIRGGAIGLFLGMLPAVWLLFQFGAEQFRIVKKVVVSRVGKAPRQFGTTGSEGVGNVFDENEAENKVLVFGGIHIGA